MVRWRGEEEEEEITPGTVRLVSLLLYVGTSASFDGKEGILCAIAIRTADMPLAIAPRLLNGPRFCNTLSPFPLVRALIH